jgi:hypothetical protein
VISIVAPSIVFFLCDNLDEDVVKEDGEESPEGALEAAPEAEEQEKEDGEGSPEDGEGGPEDGEGGPEDGEGGPEDGEESPEDAVEDIEDGESKTLSIHIIQYKVLACFCFALSFLPNVLAA